MEPAPFASAFGALYRELYARAVRRVDDGRDGLSNESTALLLHLAQAGPLALSELAQHLGRALSTVSAKVGALEEQGLLARQRDVDDNRRSLIWLSPGGRDALAQALDVLDRPRLAAAAALLPAESRARLVADLQALLAALPPPTPPGGTAP